MSGSLCFDVSSSIQRPSTLRVTDLIFNTAELVTFETEVLHHAITDRHLFVLTEESILALQLHELRDVPLAASLLTSSPDALVFKPAPTVKVSVENTALAGRQSHDGLPSCDLLIVATHSRVLLADQREKDTTKLYKIFDESSPSSHLVQLQLPEGLGRIKRMKGGADHVLVLTETGRVWAMGTGSHGELGVGSVCSSPIDLLECDLPDDVIIDDIAAGSWHSVAMTTSSDVYVWGWNNEGQLGKEQEDKCVYSPMPLDIDDVMSIDAYECATQIVTEDKRGSLAMIVYGRRLISDEDD
ncbi:hypothetical protein PFISCL1PPCAC_13361 [Pristionchus fissidentatus]|uniref:Uncharacterized protein n=1 Tax=Pristionchus fissidentatus TaxID=1538716 RepID=A0AAV5VUJ3_9BILA|nr:hypothetical protein PFISCL1PPCAC_13361 [Pristionchus fissidentatus]